MMELIDVLKYGAVIMLAIIILLMTLPARIARFNHQCENRQVDIHTGEHNDENAFYKEDKQ